MSKATFTSAPSPVCPPTPGPGHGDAFRPTKTTQKRIRTVAWPAATHSCKRLAFALYCPQPRIRHRCHWHEAIGPLADVGMSGLIHVTARRPGSGSKSIATILGTPRPGLPLERHPPSASHNAMPEQHPEASCSSRGIPGNLLAQPLRACPAQLWLALCSDTDVFRAGVALWVRSPRGG